MSYNLILLQKTKHKYDKWRLLVISVTFLFFCICFVLVVMDNINAFKDPVPTINCSILTNFKNQTNHGFQTNQQESQSLHPCAMLNFKEYCEITCTSVHIQDIGNEVTTDCISNSIHLILKKVAFNNKSIEKDWLSNFPSDVKELQIISGLERIRNMSFAGKPFENLERITLSNTMISYLKQDSFLNSNIKYIQIQFDTNQDINFEKGVFIYLNSLNNIQCTRCNIKPKGLKNLLDSNLSALAELDLRYGEIESILSQTFLKTKNLKQLYLTQSQIKYLEPNAFEGLENTFIQISENQLETLPENVIRHRMISKILILDNPWMCNCSLEWFKRFYIENNWLFSESFYCTTSTGRVNYNEIDFCPSSSSTTSPASNTTSTTTTQPITSTGTLSTTSSTGTISTTSSTATISTLVPDNDVTFYCENHAQSHRFNIRNSRIYSHTVSVRNGTITYDFYEIEATPNYEVKLNNSIDTDYMIWFNIKNHTDSGCIFNIQEEYEDRVSPFDCTSLIVQPVWEDRPWIFNKDKVLLILLYVFTIFIMIIISATVMYFTVKRNPQMIKANKLKIGEHVRGYNNFYVKTPSLYSTSDGYLTPTPTRLYETVYPCIKRRISALSTISEQDCEEGGFNVVYKVSDMYNKELCAPPPLPPNHPLSLRTISSLVRSKSLNIDKRTRSTFTNERGNTFPRFKQLSYN